LDKGFKYWFTNVFWYHYRAHLFAGLAAAAVIIYFVYSMLNKHVPDFMFALVSRNPVFDLHAEAVKTRFNERGYDTLGTALFLSEDNPEVMLAWQLLMITMVDDEYALFFVGESALDSFEEQFEGFLPMSEAGFPPSALDPRMTEIPGDRIAADMGLGSETYYALIKRPRAENNGTIKPENTARTDKAAECLAGLLEN
jgi:hypothetical protein